MFWSPHPLLGVETRLVEGHKLVSVQEPRSTGQSIVTERWQVRLQQIRSCDSTGKHTGPEKLRNSLTTDQKTETKKRKLPQHHTEPQILIRTSIQHREDWS